MSKSGEYAVGGGDTLEISSLAVASHELKAPLALIRQLSLELQTSNSPEHVQLLAEHIRLSAERSLRLTTNIAKSSKLQTTVFDLAPLHPSAVMQDVRRELTPLYSAKDRQLSLRMPHKLPLVITHRDLLHRIMSNFVDNALHYSDEEGVVELYCQLRRKDNVIRMAVRDYGPMIPANVWQALQANSVASSSLRPDSSGLGLMISHRFADAIHARIGAVRHRDGASFYVDVPISSQVSLL